MFFERWFAAGLLATGILLAQGTAPDPPGDTAPAPEVAKPGPFTVAAGTKVPLSLINSISTKHSVEGDRVYLETAFPILSGGRIVIPVGSYVAGTVTQIKRPGRAKGRGELYIRFDSLTLPNGVTRDFRGRMGSMDGTNPGDLDRAEGKVTSEGNKVGDARTIGEVAGAGASVGAIAGSASSHTADGSRDRRGGRRGGGVDRGAGDAWTGCRADEGQHRGDGSGPVSQFHRERTQLRELSAAAQHAGAPTTPENPKSGSTLGRRFPW